MNHSMDFKSNHSDYNNHLGENNVFYSNINQTNCSTTFSRPEIVNTDQNSFADIKPIAGLDSNLNSQMNNKNNFTLENTIINGNHEQHQLEQENELTKTNQNSNLFNEDDINESILMAVSKMNLCDIPIKRQIFEELLKNESNVQNRFKLFIKIENNLTLFPLEQEKLDELVAACQLLKNPYKHIVKKTNHLSDGIQITEAAICRLIKMSNKLKSFNRLDQKDKIALLKNSIIEMFCIRTTINYNCENNSWYFVDDKNKGLSLVSMEVLKAAKINYLSHKNFAIKYNSQFINDSKICDLLTVIILFRPSRATVSNIDIIKEEFANYCYLLKRYLHVKYEGDSCAAKNSYITLMHRLEELFHLSEEIVHLYLDMNPQNASELFVELFDLN